MKTVKNFEHLHKILFRLSLETLWILRCDFNDFVSFSDRYWTLAIKDIFVKEQFTRCN